jgi:hypothetical protein
MILRENKKHISPDAKEKLKENEIKRKEKLEKLITKGRKLSGIN